MGFPYLLGTVSPGKTVSFPDLAGRGLTHSACLHAEHGSVVPDVWEPVVSCWMLRNNKSVHGRFQMISIKIMAFFPSGMMSPYDKLHQIAIQENYLWNSAGTRHIFGGWPMPDGFHGQGRQIASLLRSNVVDPAVACGRQLCQCQILRRFCHSISDLTLDIFR